jgi:hypothetical protein
MMNFLKDWIIQYQNKYSVGGVETTIDRVTGTISQEGDTIMASYLNEIQKNCIYQVNATRVVEGVLEIYDIVVNGSEEFTPFNQTFLIDFSATNTQVDSLLRFNGITYSLRFSDSIGDISIGIGFIPKRAFVKLDVANSKAIIVSNLNFLEETINFTSATGTVTIPSGLPIGTKKIIRKLNATQGIVTISCSGETFTASAISSVKLNSDGDYWLLEKVSATRWDLVDGMQKGSNINGEWLLRADGIQECNISKEISIAIGAQNITSYIWSFPLSFNSVYFNASAVFNPNASADFYGHVYTNPIVAGYYVSFVIKNGAVAQNIAKISAVAKGRWY